MTLKLLCGLSAAALFASSLFAAAAPKAGTLHTKDGQTYIGELDESGPENVVVKRGNISTPVPRNRIASIEYAADYEKGFRDRLSKLPANDAPSRVKLAREAFDRRQYMLARDVCDEAQKIDPNNAEAAELMNLIQSQIRLERQAQQQQSKPSDTTAPAGSETAGAGATTQPVNEKLLTPAQVNAIRLAELRPEDAGVRVKFDRDVKKRFMEYTQRNPAEINSLTTGDLVQAILKEGTSEMKRDVQILNDPPAMLQYRRGVQPFVLQNCATTGCHGTAKSQKFALVSPGDSDAAAYTNFYILQSYVKKLPNAGENVFGQGELRVIDRQAPERSLLLQYGLPGAAAEFDHPDVPGYRPSYRGMNDRNYTVIRQWLAESLVAVQPDYGFTYAGTSPATQPATTDPATQPATTRAATRTVRPTPPARPR